MKAIRCAALTALALVAGSLVVSRDVSAAAGQLDPGFGTDGIATLMVGDPGSRAMALDIQDDGKIVITGRSADDKLIVSRFNADGSLDTDFADAGVFTSDLIRRGEDVDAVSGGKILATGSNDDHVLKLNSDGTPDQSFSADGVSGSQFFNPDDQSETEEPNMARVLPWPGDQVLVAGTVDYGPYFFTFARYNPDGTLDDTFGDDGQVQTDFTPSGDGLDQEPLALAAYPGDRFVAAGYRDVDDTNPEASVVAMYKADGTLDDSFGDDGKTTTDFFNLYEAIEEVFALGDGRILAIGDGQLPLGTGGIQEVTFIARYDPDGTLNDGFGTNGRRMYDEAGSQQVQGAAVAADGSIIVVGAHSDQGSQAFVARFDENGNPDPEFGEDGWEFFGTPEAPSAQFHDVAFDADGDILIAGAVQTASGMRAAVFKLKSTFGTPRVWGDHNCSGAADPIDSLLTLRHDAGLGANTGTCPLLGTGIDAYVLGVLSAAHSWGDIDCSGEVNPVDSLKLLRFDAGMPGNQPANCPELTTEVFIVLLAA